MKKLGGSQTHILFHGCTTDSGGGGTGESLHMYMQDLNLCVEDDSYLVGFCCLHTLQLTLSNAMAEVIGKGGLDERNATQVIHAFYDLQEAMEFGLWEMYWKKTEVELGITSADKTRVKKLAAPTLTRWWTVGEAAKIILKHLPILLEIARRVRNANPSNTKLNKIASGLLSLMDEPIIVSDIKLISSFHEAFLNHHFHWLQNGDEGIGGTPGYLGRHMLVRYFLMHSDLKKMVDDGWKTKVGKEMQPFLNSLEEEGLNKPIPSPEDPTKTTLDRYFQSKKANMFFKTSLEILQKHYEDAFCKRLLFLALYGEQCSSQIVARALLLKNHFFLGEDDTVVSKAQRGRTIDISAFSTFIRERIDVTYQMSNFHTKKLSGCLELLAGKLIYNYYYCEFVFFTYFNPSTSLFTSWQSHERSRRTCSSLADVQNGVRCISYNHPFCRAFCQSVQFLQQQKQN